ncbi:MAG: hypothetical protein ACI4DO_10930 [Roseburia sp.]
MNDEINVTTRYKDTIFRMLFDDKQRLLELYNALNNTEYDDPNALEIVTLENAIYMSMKNDVSCLLDMRMQLYEQQSTINPNMPLRNLMYVCEQYEKYIIKKDIYSSRLLKLPTPKFVVFYNGLEPQPERRELRLSDAFEIPEETPSLELRVIQFNINPGYNADLLSKCPTLFQYIQYVEQVRNFRKTHPLNEAVQLAVDYCIKHGTLVRFLLENKAEVIRMSIFEYDEELHKKTLRDEGFEDGFTAGFNDGFNDGKLTSLTEQVCRKLKKNKTLESIADELEEDLDTVKQICDAAKSYAPNYDVTKIVEQLQMK